MLASHRLEPANALRIDSKIVGVDATVSTNVFYDDVNLNCLGHSLGWIQRTLQDTRNTITQMDLWLSWGNSDYFIYKQATKRVWVIARHALDCLQMRLTLSGRWSVSQSAMVWWLKAPNFNGGLFLFLLCYCPSFRSHLFARVALEIFSRSLIWFLHRSQFASSSVRYWLCCVVLLRFDEIESE